MRQAYDVMNFYKEYGVAQKLARSDLFEKITLGVICFSAQSSKCSDFGPCSLAFPVIDMWEP